MRGRRLIYCLVLLMLILIVPLVTLLLVMMAANWEHLAHLNLIASINVGVRRKLAQLVASGRSSGPEHEALSCASETYDSITAHIDSDARGRPLTVFFVLPATVEVLSSFLTAATVGAAFIVSLLERALYTQYGHYWNNVSEATPSNASLSDLLATAAMGGNTTGADTCAGDANPPEPVFELALGVLLCVFAGIGVVFALPAAFILGFVTSFNQVPVSLFLSGPGVRTLPVDMIAYMEINYDPSVAALSALLAFMSVAIVFAAEKFLGFSKYV